MNLTVSDLKLLKYYSLTFNNSVIGVRFELKSGVLFDIDRSTLESEGVRVTALSFNRLIECVDKNGLIATRYEHYSKELVSDLSSNKRLVRLLRKYLISNDESLNYDKVINGKSKLSVNGKKYKSFVELHKDYNYLTEETLKKRYLRGLRGTDLVDRNRRQKPVKMPTKSRYGMYTIIKQVDPPSHLKSPERIYFECKCDCGTIGILPKSVLVNKIQVSCGCINRNNINVEVNGKVYSRLTKLAKAYSLDIKLVKARYADGLRGDALVSNSGKLKRASNENTDEFKVNVRGKTYTSIPALQKDYDYLSNFMIHSRYRQGKRGEDLIKKVKPLKSNDSGING